MARHPTTRLQISGYRFLLRRSEHALLRSDPQTPGDPLRAQKLSLAAGCVLAAIALGVCVILAYLRPHGTIGDAPILMARESGALYVRIDDTVHPVLNLASAQLIAATNANPARVAESALHSVKRGPLLGIPGAPSLLGEPVGEEDSAWTVCDAQSADPALSLTTTVIAGAVATDRGTRRLSSDATVLVASQSAPPSAAYLLYDGHRAAVDLADAALIRALHLEGVAPRPISAALLNAIPELPAIVAPRIFDAGTPGPAPLAGFPVGSVVRMSRAGNAEHYVVLSFGVQRIGEVAADLIRLTDSQGSREIASIAPDVISAVPLVSAVAVDTFPARVAAPVFDPVLCLNWVPTGGTDTAVLAGTGLPLSSSRTPVELAQADGDGPNVDAVFIPAGRSAYVRSTGFTGDLAHGASTFAVTDTGVRFGIPDAESAGYLGLTSVEGDAPRPAAWPILGLLPGGPELSRTAALVAHDGLGVAPAS